MPKKYRSGFERLSVIQKDTDQRYQTALQAVRENFTGFGKKDGYKAPSRLTDAQRKQVRRYYNLLTEYTEGSPVYKMTPSELPKAIKAGGRKNVEAVMRAAQMPHGRKRARYIFIKYDGETIPQVSIKNGSPVFVNKRAGYMREVIELNTEALAVDPRGTVLSVGPLVQGAKFFRILNGRHEFYGPRGAGAVAADLHTLANEVIRLQEKYGIHTKDNWQRWMYGISAYYTDEPLRKIVRHINKSKEDFQERVKRENAKLKRARKSV